MRVACGVLLRVHPVAGRAKARAQLRLWAGAGGRELHGWADAAGEACVWEQGHAAGRGELGPHGGAAAPKLDRAALRQAPLDLARLSLHSELHGLRVVLLRALKALHAGRPAPHRPAHHLCLQQPGAQGGAGAVSPGVRQ